MTDTTELAIPEDIRFVAANTGEEVRRFPGATDWIIARAILAERERCAKISEMREASYREQADRAYEMDSPGGPYMSAKFREIADEAADIAAAIRGGGKQ